MHFYRSKNVPQKVASYQPLEPVDAVRSQDGQPTLHPRCGTRVPFANKKEFTACNSSSIHCAEAETRVPFANKKEFTAGNSSSIHCAEAETFRFFHQASAMITTSCRGKNVTSHIH
jgi:hypothetical protein